MCSRMSIDTGSELTRVLKSGTGHSAIRTETTDSSKHGAMGQLSLSERLKVLQSCTAQCRARKVSITLPTDPISSCREANRYTPICSYNSCTCLSLRALSGADSAVFPIFAVHVCRYRLATPLKSTASLHDRAHVEGRLHALQEKQAAAELAAELYATRQALQSEAVLAVKIHSKLTACLANASKQGGCTEKALAMT